MAGFERRGGAASETSRLQAQRGWILGFYMASWVYIMGCAFIKAILGRRAAGAARRATVACGPSFAPAGPILVGHGCGGSRGRGVKGWGGYPTQRGSLPSNEARAFAGLKSEASVLPPKTKFSNSAYKSRSITSQRYRHSKPSPLRNKTGVICSNSSRAVRLEQ
jgi:hypothetical protein